MHLWGYLALDETLYSFIQCLLWKYMRENLLEMTHNTNSKQMQWENSTNGKSALQHPLVVFMSYVMCIREIIIISVIIYSCCFVCLFFFRGEKNMKSLYRDIFHMAYSGHVCQALKGQKEPQAHQKMRPYDSFNSIQITFIFIPLFTIHIILKQLDRKCNIALW